MNRKNTSLRRARRAAGVLGLSVTALLWALVAVVPGHPLAAQQDDALGIPLPSLDSVEQAVREQIQEALATLRKAKASQLAPAELGAAYGELGQLLLAYDFSSSASAALERARELDDQNPRWPYLLGSLFQLDGAYAQAAAALERAKALAPGDPTTSARLAAVRLAQDQPKQAADQVGGLEKREGFAAFAAYVRGRAAAATGDAASAVAAFQRALEQQPDAGIVHYHLGLAYRDLGQADKAREQMALRNDREVRYPDPIAAEVSGLLRGVGPSLLLARLRLAAGELDRAAEYAEQALRLEPSSPQVLRFLGTVRLRQGRPDEGIVFFRDALEQDPGDVGFRFFFASLLAGEIEGAPLPQDDEARKRRLEEAAQRFQETVQQLPGYAQAWHGLAKVELALDDSEAALSALDKALEADPDFALARLDRGALEGYAGDVDAALADLHSLADSPLEDDAALVEVRVLERAGRKEEALARWREMAESAGSPERRATGWFHLGNDAADKGDDEQAEARYRQALELDPKMAEVHFNLGTLLGRHRRFAEAAEQQAAVVALQPDNHQARFGEAMALVLAGRYVDARQRLEKALELYPSVPVFAHLLARLMATAPDDAVRDGMGGLDLAARLYQAYPTLDHAETVAMAFAEAGAFDRAVEWQEKVVEGLENAKDGDHTKELEIARRYLEKYRKHQPVRSPWLENG